MLCSQTGKKENREEKKTTNYIFISVVIDRWFMLSPDKLLGCFFLVFFFKCLPFSTQFPKIAIQVVLCNKPSGASGYPLNRCFPGINVRICDVSKSYCFYVTSLDTGFSKIRGSSTLLSLYVRLWLNNRQMHRGTMSSRCQTKLSTIVQQQLWMSKRQNDNAL